MFTRKTEIPNNSKSDDLALRFDQIILFITSLRSGTTQKGLKIKVNTKNMFHDKLNSNTPYTRIPVRYIISMIYFHYRYKLTIKISDICI